MSLPLEELQARFAAAVLDADCEGAVAPLLASPGPALRGRLASYRAHLAAAWEQALANQFPVVRTLVGDDFFASLARAYQRTHASTSGDLNRYGAFFAQFIAGFAPAQSLPYLADVAALEWNTHVAYYAADATALARDRITSLPAGELLGATFALHPACAWVESPFPIASIWRGHQPNHAGELPRAIDRAECALVVRPLWRVEVLVSSAGEIGALAELRSGNDMEAAIAAGLQADAAFDFPKALVRWLDAAVLVEPAND